MIERPIDGWMDVWMDRRDHFLLLQRKTSQTVSLLVLLHSSHWVAPLGLLRHLHFQVMICLNGRTAPQCIVVLVVQSSLSSVSMRVKNTAVSCSPPINLQIAPVKNRLLSGSVVESDGQKNVATSDWRQSRQRMPTLPLIGQETRAAGLLVHLLFAEGKKSVLNLLCR